MNEIADLRVRSVFEDYPLAAHKKILRIRHLIFECAGKENLIVSESLKWGEPSYACKGGSPFRLGVREEPQLTLCLLFHCQSRLVDTFREIYGDELSFDGNRAVLLPADKKLPVAILKDCIIFALQYHRRKHMPLLGAQ